MTAANTKGLYSAQIGIDNQIGSTVISLFYEDSENPVHNMTIGIAPEFGSNMFRFRIGENEIIHYEQDLLKQRAFTGNFVLWPLPNRIRGKRYSYQGQSYSLEDIKRPSGNDVLIHGLVFDRKWQHNEPIIEHDAVSVTTYIDITPDSPHFAAYPFVSRLSLTYTLTRNGVGIIYHVQNNDDKELPFGFALHPYFAKLPGKDNTLISLPARQVMEADNDLLPTGRVLDVDTVMYAMFDLREPQLVGHLKLDHVYTEIQNQKSAIIEYKKQAIQLHISASDDFTHCVIYAPPGDDPCFCLEYQTCSTDAINLHNQGPELQKMANLLEVKPGGSFTGTLQYAVYFGHQ